METPESAIKISDVAAEKLKELLASQEEQDQALRVAVRVGGCSGFQYALALDKRKEDDHVFEHNGVSVLVDKVSMQFVFGSRLTTSRACRVPASRLTTRTSSPPAVAGTSR